MVEPSFFALTSTPSMVGSTGELTCPESVAEASVLPVCVCAVAGWNTSAAPAARVSKIADRRIQASRPPRKSVLLSSYIEPGTPFPGIPVGHFMNRIRSGQGMIPRAIQALIYDAAPASANTLHSADIALT